MLSFIVWQIESAITAVVPQMGRVRVFDVVGNVVQAKKHDFIKTVIDFPNFSFNLLLIWRARYWGVVLSARRSGLDWMSPAPSIPAITSIPAVAHRTLCPSHFSLLPFSLKVVPAYHLGHHDTYPSFRTSSNLPIQGITNWQQQAICGLEQNQFLPVLFHFDTVLFRCHSATVLFR